MSASIMEPTEVVRYVLMPPQKVRTFATEISFSAESYIKEVRSAWKTRVYSKADQVEIINDSTSHRGRLQMRLPAPTNDPSELLQTILKFYCEQKTLPELNAHFYAIRQNSK